TAFYTLGAPIADQTSVYFHDSGTDTCKVYGAGESSPIVNPMLATFSIGAAVPPASFADATEVHTGSGRIQIIQATAGGAPPVASVGFFDSVQGQPCMFHRQIQAADGVVRCLPPSTDTDVFADADCSVPL